MTSAGRDTVPACSCVSSCPSVLTGLEGATVPEEERAEVLRARQLLPLPCQGLLLLPLGRSRRASETRPESQQQQQHQQPTLQPHASNREERRPLQRHMRTGRLEPADVLAPSSAAKVAGAAGPLRDGRPASSPKGAGAKGVALVVAPPSAFASPQSMGRAGLAGADADAAAKGAGEGGRSSSAAAAATAEWGAGDSRGGLVGRERGRGDAAARQGGGVKRRAGGAGTEGSGSEGVQAWDADGELVAGSGAFEPLGPLFTTCALLGEAGWAPVSGHARARSCVCLNMCICLCLCVCCWARSHGQACVELHKPLRTDFCFGGICLKEHRLDDQHAQLQHGGYPDMCTHT